MADHKYPFVSITWFDAADLSETWVNVESDRFEEFCEEPCAVTSHGYLLKKTKLYYVLCADVCSEGIVGRVTKIPVPWVTKVSRQRLKDVKFSVRSSRRRRKS